MTSQPIPLFPPEQGRVPDENFLVDANVLITAHHGYYALDLCPGFWDCLIHHSNAGRILSIDRVRDELVGYGDALSDWVRDIAPPELFVPSLGEAVTDSYREVMRWVYANNQFSLQAKDEFSRGADGWLVAYARVHNVIIVTLEAHHPDARRRVPLPNVCEQFGVPRVNTFEMLNELGVYFDWRNSG